jgi:hypothetical protein
MVVTIHPLPYGEKEGKLVVRDHNRRILVETWCRSARETEYDVEILLTTPSTASVSQ